MKLPKKIPDEIANSFLVKHASLNLEQVLKLVMTNLKGCEKAKKLLESN
jgi:hypothetical protein